MITEAVERFKKLLTNYFEIDDWQAALLVIAVAVSHKLGLSEMLWLRIIGASGSGKTEMLRTLTGQEGFCTTMESITAGSIRRGFVHKKKSDNEETLLKRISGKLVITKEFASMLTKEKEAQKEIFGLLRSVYDGTLDADYGSEQGHLQQSTYFDWIIGSTSYIDKVRNIEYLLGSRFIDLRWERPIQRLEGINKAIKNDGHLNKIRADLLRAMTDIIETAEVVPEVRFDYIAVFADITSALRSPVERDNKTREIEDLPEIELGTRIGQALSRIARGLLMVGVSEREVKPYLLRIVFDSMTRIRSSVVKSWVDGITNQQEIAVRAKVSQGAISRVIEDIKVLGWEEQWAEILKG